ncbi:MAG: hypothetical protein LLG04_02815, partial [Parachlamydia sp.]|nr:hypothetical protein [Parachlamydia sp.]
MSGVGGAPGAHEGSYLLRDGERLAEEPNETTEKLKTLGNAVLMGAFYATGAALAGFRSGWIVLGTTLATSSEVFAFSRLNLEDQTRKALFFMVAGITYELFLGLFTTAQANSESQGWQYVPLIA